MIQIISIINGLSIFQAHLTQEHQNPVCEYCKQTFNSIARLNDHQQNECTLITIHCALKDFGCSEAVSKIEYFFLVFK